VAQHHPVNLHDVSSTTTEASPAVLNLDDNYSFSNEVYIKPAESIKTNYSAKQHNNSMKQKRVKEKDSRYIQMASAPAARPCI
jgi:hypothetical protein